RRGARRLVRALVLRIGAGLLLPVVRLRVRRALRLEPMRALLAELRVGIVRRAALGAGARRLRRGRLALLAVGHPAHRLLEVLPDERFGTVAVGAEVLVEQAQDLT